MSDIDLVVGDGFDVQTLFHTINKAVVDCAEQQVIDPLIETMIGFKQLHERSGVALAWMWYRTKAIWHLFDIGDNFEDTIATRTGYNVEVVRRYVRVAEMLDNAPSEVLDSLSNKGIKALIPVANAHAGYDFTDENWQTLAETDPSDIPGYVREEIKHAEHRNGSVRLYLDRTGSIWAYNGDDERRFIGSLELSIAKEDGVVEKAINRIINSSGIRME